eukprot:TRINITY_DN13750_c0_g1_i1.p1 TRINITY_DN13750_c0_g1~~TRINITY_DN13750_c0_g1_i1.p1  ORF type:complete len:214 (+),score=34.32 TRINITY_DN13750_c0_g1_i1:54-695(+)
MKRFLEQSVNIVAKASKSVLLADMPIVPGLKLQKAFITRTEERALVEKIDACEWDTSLRRRVQHYGHRYDYSNRAVSADTSDKTLPIPEWCTFLTDRLLDVGIFAKHDPPTQLIINEYQPGQGISAHTDQVRDFGPVVVSLSLLTTVTMDLSNASTVHQVQLDRCSLLVLTEDARYKWRHAIAARKTDCIDGVTAHRGRRISLTFRTLTRKQS